MLFLLPAFLSEESSRDLFAPVIAEVIAHTDHYFVENEKTARKVIKFFNPEKKQSALKIFLLNKHSHSPDLKEAFMLLKAGTDFGVLSEAGLPAIADPGNLAVAFAHQNDIRVCPVDGPSSIILALISSGFNGQKFTFHGYLALDKTLRRKEIQRMEELANSQNHTQIFMETPYRNNQLMDALVSTMKPKTLLSVAANIQHPTEQFILTKTAADWKKERPDFHKIPVIFSIGRFP